MAGQDSARPSDATQTEPAGCGDIAQGVRRVRHVLVSERGPLVVNLAALDDDTALAFQDAIAWRRVTPARIRGHHDNQVSRCACAAEWTCVRNSRVGD
ncbi:DUF6207 family protein [Streptomyces sp. MNU76]|uniref:DUF6207 family protein n=1 Tax=Streptomyces sp. MNU76 TaxID=2560026 RepID=UPI0035A8C9EB